MRKARIKTILRKLTPPPAIGRLYWEDQDSGAFYRLPSMDEWQENDAAFRQIERPDPEDMAQTERWVKHGLAFAKSKRFRANKVEIERREGPVTNIPLQRHGRPCVKGLIEGPTGEFPSVMRLYNKGVDFYRGANRALHDISQKGISHEF